MLLVIDGLAVGMELSHCLRRAGSADHTLQLLITMYAAIVSPCIQKRGASSTWHTPRARRNRSCNEFQGSKRACEGRGCYMQEKMLSVIGECITVCCRQSRVSTLLADSTVSHIVDPRSGIRNVSMRKLTLCISALCRISLV